MLPYLQDIKPVGCILQCREKFPQTALLIDLTRQQNHAKLPSLARATEKHNFLLSQPSQFSL